LTFIHGYLLGGLVLVGLPVLIHLIMRQRPRRLSFPAFRFLRQQHRINQRRLRLQHLLLLLLRMFLIAALCLALARPRLRSGSLSLGAEQPVAAVLVMDTSESTGLSDGKQTRLDEARTRAREVLDDMADGSRLALIDAGDDTASGEGVDELSGNLGLTRTRLDELRLRPACGALNRAVARAAHILQRVATDEEPLPRFLYVFSDRTRASWDKSASPDALPLDGINVVYVDVGKDGARDLAIEDVKVEPPVVEPGGPIRIRVAVRASGGDFENDLTCQIDNDPEVGSYKRSQVKLSAGRSDEVVFERNAPQRPTASGDAPYQVTVKLVNDDALPFNDARHATFVVRDKPHVLTLADEPKDARFWAMAIRAKGTFDVVAKRPGDLVDGDLSSARVVCLFQLRHPEAELWEKLGKFVRQGGGLAVVPGDDAMQTDVYTLDAAAKLLPGKFTEFVKVPADKPHVLWAPFEGQDDLTRPFREWVRTTSPDFAREELRPFVNAYWIVEPSDFAVASYQDGKKHPALLSRPVGAGRVVQLTSPLDARMFPGQRPWHNYWLDSSFGLVLVDRVCSFLAGTATVPDVNFLSGTPAQLALAGALPAPPLKLTGPEPAATAARVAIDEGRITVNGADEPGNYQIRDGKGAVAAAFSVAVRREESNLERIPVEELEAILGKGTVLPAERRTSLRELLQGRWSAPVELLPWLMLLLLLAMSFEAFLANRFYRRPAEESGEG
jgi:Aerotolerance regulator N-terminal